MKGVMTMKSFVVGCVILCAGCASLMSEEARKRMEERRKKSEEFVGLAQKYGYSGRILSSDARLGGSRGDDTKEWARKLFNCEITPNEEECQLCYDRDGSQDNDWDSFVRYNLIKWSNENLARWGRGFKEQFAYQRTFYPQSFMEFKFRKEYSLGWREAGHAPMNVSGEEAAFIVFTTTAMGLGNMGVSGVDDLKRDTRHKERIRSGTVDLKRSFRGFKTAKVAVDSAGRIESIELTQVFPEGVVFDDLIAESKNIWKLIGEKYQIVATQITNLGDWSWSFENDFCKLQVYLWRGVKNPEIKVKVRVDNNAIDGAEAEEKERTRKASIQPIKVKINSTEGADVL